MYQIEYLIPVTKKIEKIYILQIFLSLINIHHTVQNQSRYYILILITSNFNSKKRVRNLRMVNLVMSKDVGIMSRIYEYADGYSDYRVASTRKISSPSEL